MNITKAVITAAAPNQRTLPLQTLVDRDGMARTVLGIIVGEARRVGIEDIAIVISPGDEDTYRAAAGEHAKQLRFIVQPKPRGYGHAVYCARSFVGDDAFFHLVGDHIFLSDLADNGAQQLIELAREQECAVSGVQATRETLLPLFGTVGGRRVAGTSNQFVIESVIEKPTPTEAEQSLVVPGLRQGHYLCFFGMHVLTPSIMELLHNQLQNGDEKSNIQLSPVLNELCGREKYLALEMKGRRYP
ncbi:MAG: UTP--glucose-phosphate uridylyltransferase, partial [Abditibacteriota bacterium]|nr:UTP--glucose-phosphate uridylyltransferase [Abditibacteriota bacterium]